MPVLASIRELEALNVQLASLLREPQPGSLIWRQNLAALMVRMAMFSGVPELIEAAGKAQKKREV